MKKVYYCILDGGIRQYAILEEDVTERSGFFIRAKRVVSIDVVPSPLAQRMNLELSVYHNVEIQCLFISEMALSAQLYPKILEVLKISNIEVKSSEN